MKCMEELLNGRIRRWRRLAMVGVVVSRLRRKRRRSVAFVKVCRLGGWSLEVGGVVCGWRRMFDVV